jgi:hypothetical protein
VGEDDGWASEPRRTRRQRAAPGNDATLENGHVELTVGGRR